MQDQMTTTTASAVKLLTPREAAERLAICERSLWTHTAPRGTLCAVKIGAAVRYDPRDLAEWIEQQKKRPDTPTVARDNCPHE